MTTPLYPTFRKRVDHAVEQIIKQQVTRWSFLTAGPPFQVKMFDGKQIAYEGVEFEGSPREVFWSRYIEPFLEGLCISEIGAAVVHGKKIDNARSRCSPKKPLSGCLWRRGYLPKRSSGDGEGG